MAKEKDIWDQIVQKAKEEESKEEAVAELKAAQKFLEDSGNKDLAKKFKATIAKLEKE